MNTLAFEMKRMYLKIMPWLHLNLNLILDPSLLLTGFSCGHVFNEI